MSKNRALAVVAIVVALAMPVRASALCGDGDQNGEVDVVDALRVALRTIDLATCPQILCDVNSDGAVMIGDAREVLRAAVGLPVVLDCAGGVEFVYHGADAGGVEWSASVPAGDSWFGVVPDPDCVSGGVDLFEANLVTLTTLGAAAIDLGSIPDGTVLATCGTTADLDQVTVTLEAAIDALTLLPIAGASVTAEPAP